MFDHKQFDNYSFENIPLDQDLFVMDEAFLHEYESSMLRFFDGADYEHVGYISYVAVRAVKKNSLELSWFANVRDRFHEISISLPRDQFVVCVGAWRCDEKPRIFVKSSWLENVYLRSYSVFALIDAAYVKKAIENGIITRPRLIELRDNIDILAKKHTDISFISFADSLLLKSNWSVGYFESNIKYTYEPEIFIFLALEINAIYQNTLGLNTYALIAQGSNIYYKDPLLHISSTHNHISLNSLGVPFSQLMDMEATARNAIKAGVHPSAELYMDEQYFHSLKFKFDFDKHAVPNYRYQTKMISTPSKYYYSSLSNVIENLEA